MKQNYIAHFYWAKKYIDVKKKETDSKKERKKKLLITIIFDGNYCCNNIIYCKITIYITSFHFLLPNAAPSLGLDTI